MQLNIICDQWIPVLRRDGSRAVIAPWEMADDALAYPDWPRPDLNIACLELLIGLIVMADPPRDDEDWRARQAPDPERLRGALEPFAPAFNLLGDGPRFMQVIEELEAAGGEVNTPDMLLIDSAGGNATKNNADLMVKRNRYSDLPTALAAMALYTLQAHAPSGGKGNRTSMRGGGPMVTLLEPHGGGLWSLIWANTPTGRAANLQHLPWTKPTRTSEDGQVVFPHDAHAIEAFFGMPRRLRLVADNGVVAGVVQKPYGTNYEGWVHPLTPYYRMKAGSELLPRRPKAADGTYRNWIGVIERARTGGTDMVRRAEVVEAWAARSSRVSDIIVAGWVMDNMKPRDFIFSRAPLFNLDDRAIERLEGLIHAASTLGDTLRYALEVVLLQGGERDAASEEFYLLTQPSFERHVAGLQADPSAFETIARDWLSDLTSTAIEIFDRQALAGLGDRDINHQQKIIEARNSLLAACCGYGKRGEQTFAALSLEPPGRNAKENEGAS